MMNLVVLTDPLSRGLETPKGECDTHNSIQETAEAFCAVLQHHMAVQWITSDEPLMAKLALLKPDLVFNLSSGKGLPQGIAAVPTLLDTLGIPYTGSSGAVHARAADPVQVMKLSKSFGIAVTELPEKSRHTSTVSVGVLGNGDNLEVNLSMALPPTLSEKLAVSARFVYRSFGLRDYATLEFIFLKEMPVLIQVHSMPTLHPDQSLLVKMSASAGRSYTDLLLSIIRSAVKRTEDASLFRQISGI